jgi:sterol desaturase/sphingolipid hydroxylase (fatty acid hydroxylase superfamily)
MRRPWHGLWNEKMVETKMSILSVFARYGYVPFMLIGINGLALYLVGNGAPLVLVALVGLIALAVTFAMERVLPYERGWNHSHGDAGKDTAHGLVYELSNLGGVVLMSTTAAFDPWEGIWPHHWPLWCQFIGAVVVADCMLTLHHYMSHRVSWFWTLHSVHHGVNRLYGFNGLVRHPLHQQIDLVIGMAPLVMAGMPVNVAVLLGLAITVQLFLQHANVDYRIGPFQHLLAVGSAHRLHHVNWEGEGDVNFGLFFTIWDRVLGTLRLTSDRPPVAGDIGVEHQPNYPQRYLAQLALPFRGTRSDVERTMERPSELAAAPAGR